MRTDENELDQPEYRRPPPPIDRAAVAKELVRISDAIHTILKFGKDAMQMEKQQRDRDRATGGFMGGNGYQENAQMTADIRIAEAFMRLADAARPYLLKEIAKVEPPDDEKEARRMEKIKRDQEAGEHSHIIERFKRLDFGDDDKPRTVEKTIGPAPAPVAPDPEPPKPKKPLAELTDPRIELEKVIRHNFVGPAFTPKPKAEERYIGPCVFHEWDEERDRCKRCDEPRPVEKPAPPKATVSEPSPDAPQVPGVARLRTPVMPGVEMLNKITCPYCRQKVPANVGKVLGHYRAGVDDICAGSDIPTRIADRLHEAT